MSFSASFPDWNVFSEREVPCDAELLSPASEMSALLQHCMSDLKTAKQETEDARSDGLEALASHAVLVYQLEKALAVYEENLQRASMTRIHKHLRVIKDQMRDALRNAGIEILVPLGQSFHEVAESVHVQGWRHDGAFQAEIVDEVLEPSVWSSGQLVRLGRVIMGAPVESLARRSEPQSK